MRPRRPTDAVCAVDSAQDLTGPNPPGSVPDPLPTAAGRATGMTAVYGIDYMGDDAMVVRLAGRLDPSDLIRILGGLTLSRPWVVLNLARVPELDPSILAVLAGAQRRLRHHGYSIALWRLRAQPWQFVHDRGIAGSVDVVDGDLRNWLSERRHGERAHRPAGAGLTASPRWPPLVSARVVTGLGTMIGEVNPHRRGAPGRGIAGPSSAGEAGSA